MHPSLERQLRKLGIDPAAEAVDVDAWLALCDRVSRSYTTADQERYLLERSLNLASAEMRELYEDRQAIAEERYLNLFESANDVIFTLGPDGRLTSVNRACEELSGYGRDELLGRRWTDVFNVADPSLSRGMALHQAPGGPQSSRFEAMILSRDGRQLPLEISSRLIAHDGVRRELLGVGRDISERKTHEAHLEYLARHDSLTGLANRDVLDDALVSVLAEVKAREQPAVLGLLDLDDFKLINDTLGHAAGDQVLVMIANVLRACLPDAVVVRLSGDEFAFILREASFAEALHAAECLRQSIELADIRIGRERVFVSASIGLVRMEADGHPGALLAEADAAMYTAKDEGRNRIHWSGTEVALTGRLAEAHRWATTLRGALEAGRMEVHYQPVVAFEPGRTGHYEALVRMRTEDDEVITAATFLSAAERYGLMPVLDRFVIDAVMQCLRETSADVHIFANLSAATLADPQMLADLMTTLRQEPHLGPRLGFEITETAALRDVALAREWIDELHTVGCRFALDDFGTGFNSLIYVRELPVDQIKIDGSFVHSIATDPKQRAVVAAVKVLADGLGMETVAECIETKAALDAIRALGITYGQGFLLGRPAFELPTQLRTAA